jgi:hypothetical protein
MIQIIGDEWFKLLLMKVDDSDLSMMNDPDLLKMNESDYWRWMNQIIGDEWWRLLEMNYPDYP